MSALGKVGDDAVGSYNWLKSLTLGEFAEKRPTSVVVADMLLAMTVPGAVVVTSARDLAAVWVRLGKRYEGVSPGQQNAAHPEWEEWVILIASALGVFGPAICAAVGGLAGAMIGDEAAGVIRAVCLLLIERSGQVLERVVGFLARFTKGNIVKLLEKIHFASYGDALVKKLKEFLQGMLALIVKARGLLSRVEYIGRARELLAELERMEKLFYAVQVNAVKEVPQALAKLDEALQKLLKDKLPPKYHPAYAGVPAPNPKIAPLKKVRISSGVGERPRELPTAKESVHGGRRANPRTADDRAESHEIGGQQSGDAAESSNVHSTAYHGAKGLSSRRDFDPTNAGGPVERLSTDGVQITHDGIDTVEQHISRFDPDPSNDFMVDRLRSIADGDMEPTQYDLNYYTHELREYERYTNLGWESGEPDDPMDARTLWNNTHTATLEDYGISDDDLFHPDAPQ